jgi:purine-cytosine permease-like protein
MSDQTPRWDVPGRIGRPGAIDSMGTIAAPFLAGIGIALAVLVISNEQAFPWVAPALLALVLATAAFIACLEFAFVARGYAITPSDLEEWATAPYGQQRTEWLEAEQGLAIRGFRRWAKLARWAYNVGIVAFSVGVACVLVPKGGLSDATDARLAAFLLAVTGCVAELVAIAATAWCDHKQRKEAKALAKRAI